jgi:hypothetical protein
MNIPPRPLSLGLANAVESVYSSDTYAGVVELVDALDSKSCILRMCRFESDRPHHAY